MLDLKIFTSNIEKSAQEQLELLSECDAFKGSKIRIMPDVHAGKGSVIGFTATYTDKVIPNVVGVDIGCAILTTSISQKDVDFKKLDKVIHDFIPSGFDIHKTNVTSFRDLNKLKCLYAIQDSYNRFICSIGTLGGGNHFIEIDKGENDETFLIIHSGSRNLGKQVAEYYQSLAKKQHPELGDLAYLTDDDKDNYLHDMKICQDYAVLNRSTMRDLIVTNMGWDINYSFETIHNYINMEDKIIRKGAISAHNNELVLIPLNMRDGCIIGKGKGNTEWNMSAPHGAGRIMSRKQASNNISLDSYKLSMKDVYSSCINEDTLDEAPFAYKSSTDIISLIKDTVDICSILKPIYNYKSSESRPKWKKKKMSINN